MNDDLAVAVGAEAMAGPNELGAQVGEVVDFAVVHRLDRAVLIRDRAATRIAEIENAQPPMDESHPIVDQHPMVIWPATRHGEGHPGEGCLVRATAVRPPHPPNSAHVVYAPTGEVRNWRITSGARTRGLAPARRAVDWIASRRRCAGPFNSPRW